MITVKHKKRGTEYNVIASAKLQTEVPVSDYTKVLIYQATDGGQIWVRPEQEMEDGRFEVVEDPISASMESMIKRMASSMLQAIVLRDKFDDGQEYEEPLRDYMQTPDTNEFLAMGLKFSNGKGFNAISDIKNDEIQDFHEALLVEALKVAVPQFIQSYYTAKVL